MNPQFNRELLEQQLSKYGVKYVFLGKELGARSSDPVCYRDGKVQYELLAQTESFKSGIERVLAGSEKFRIALLCAEKDPLTCHRAILVSRKLEERSLNVEHVLADGRVETHSEMEERMLEHLNMNTEDMFCTKEQLLDRAYRIQGEAIAYEEQQPAPEPN